MKNASRLKDLLDSDFVICVDNTGVEDELGDFDIFRISDVMFCMKNNVMMFALHGKPDKTYDYRRFKKFAFSQN